MAYKTVSWRKDSTGIILCLWFLELKFENLQKLHNWRRWGMFVSQTDSRDCPPLSWSGIVTTHYSTVQYRSCQLWAFTAVSAVSSSVTSVTYWSWRIHVFYQVWSMSSQSNFVLCKHRLSWVFFLLRLKWQYWPLTCKSHSEQAENFYRCLV